MSAATDNDNDYRIKSGPWAGAWKVAAGVGVVGLGAAAALGAGDMKRFAFSYLFAFATFLTLALGATFFVLLQHVTSAGWSASVRRIAEFFMSALPIFALLFVPIALNVDNLYGEWTAPGDHGAEHGAAHGSGTEHGGGETAPPGHGDHAMPTEHGEHADRAGHGDEGGPRGFLTEEQIEHLAHLEVVEKKGAYLNKTRFFAFALVYFIAWILVSQRLFRNSTNQDATRDLQWTNRSQAMAPWAIAVMALTTTFAAFDWYMSLLPAWYSTIFGVNHFASCIVVIFAVLTLFPMLLRKQGLTGDAITVEHFHDLGKLLFGFNCFWAYISFAQFFLIWYAGIPEEAEFYHLRWSEGPWTYVSWAIVFLHFVVPFVLLMSRNVKRNLTGLAWGAVILLVMHVVEIYWLIMPNYAHAMHIPARDAASFSPGVLDLLCFAGVGGIYLAMVFRNMASYPIIAVGDPRLERARHFENV